jgi:hypothetical protein
LYLIIRNGNEKGAWEWHKLFFLQKLYEKYTSKCHVLGIKYKIDI